MIKSIFFVQKILGTYLIAKIFTWFLEVALITFVFGLLSTIFIRFFLPFIDFIAVNAGGFEFKLINSPTYIFLFF